MVKSYTESYTQSYTECHNSSKCGDKKCVRIIGRAHRFYKKKDC